MKKLLIIFVALLTIFSLAVAPAALADDNNDDNDDILGGSDEYANLGLAQYGPAAGLGTKDVRDTVAQIIRVSLGLLGIVAVVIILLGGFKWMIAGGNDEKVKEARKLIISGIIGLAIILAAYAIAEFVISSLQTATTGTYVE